MLASVSLHIRGVGILLGFLAYLGVYCGIGNYCVLRIQRSALSGGLFLREGTPWSVTFAGLPAAV